MAGWLDDWKVANLMAITEAPLVPYELPNYVPVGDVSAELLRVKPHIPDVGLTAYFDGTFPTREVNGMLERRELADLFAPILEKIISSPLTETGPEWGFRVMADRAVLPSGTGQGEATKDPRWHNRDPRDRFIATDVLPPQVAAGSIALRPDQLEMHHGVLLTKDAREPWPEDDRDWPDTVQIVTVKPGELAGLGLSHVHRGQRNRSNEAVERTRVRIDAKQFGW